MNNQDFNITRDKDINAIFSRLIEARYHVEQYKNLVKSLEKEYMTACLEYSKAYIAKYNLYYGDTIEILDGKNTYTCKFQHVGWHDGLTCPIWVGPLHYVGPILVGSILDKDLPYVRRALCPIRFLEDRVKIL